MSSFHLLFGFKKALFLIQLFYLYQIPGKGIMTRIIKNAASALHPAQSGTKIEPTKKITPDLLKRQYISVFLSLSTKKDGSTRF
jgi:hypothetical protein